VSAFPAERRLVPELLDTMPPEAPEARASRRDLRRINTVMLQARILAGLLTAHVSQPPRRIVELGCGDGHATLAVMRKVAPAWPGGRLTLVDAQPVVCRRVLAEMSALGWAVEVVTADVFDWLGQAPHQDLAIANLFLHHFDGAALSRLLYALARLSRMFVATEPRRSTLALIAARSVRAIGANAVTRHDAAASVRAGFRDAELTAHWPGQVRFDAVRGPLTQAFVASGLRRDA
jgi:SAM-dependent methyltransferase